MGEWERARAAPAGTHGRQGGARRVAERPRGAARAADWRAQTGASARPLETRGRSRLRARASSPLSAAADVYVFADRGRAVAGALQVGVPIELVVGPRHGSGWRGRRFPAARQAGPRAAVSSGRHGEPVLAEGQRQRRAAIMRRRGAAALRAERVVCCCRQRVRTRTRRCRRPAGSPVTSCYVRSGPEGCCVIWSASTRHAVA